MLTTRNQSHVKNIKLSFFAAKIDFGQCKKFELEILNLNVEWKKITKVYIVI